MKRFILSLTCLLTLALAVHAAEPAKLVKNKQGATQLIVDGRPYIMIAGELHNSSNSTAEYMNALWPGLRSLNLNTVLAAVAWEQVEPQEGRFDFSLVDNLLRGAREQQMKVVILWFGSWKNGESSYVPTWVKRDTKRFKRVRTANGKEIETLSPFCEANLQADARAFRRLMEHIRDIDSQHRTVIAIQTENEVGLFQDMDYTAEARKAYEGQVPAALIHYMKKHERGLRPELLRVWKEQGKKNGGTWKQVFGDNAWSKSFCITWQYARYINKVAEGCKEVYPLPTFVNSWIVQKEDDLPGVYPNGGPVSRVFDIWKAAAPSIDVLCPDIYLDDFKRITADYKRADNPLLIPESKAKSAQAFWAFAEHSALCYSPFGIEDVAGDYGYSKTCAVLQELMPVITAAQGSDRMYGIWKTGNEHERTLTMGDYRLHITYDQRQAYGLIIQTKSDEFIVAGIGFKVGVEAAKDGDKTAYILQAWEGGFDKEGLWQTHRLLNGDETNHNKYLPVKGPGIYRLTTYLR